MALYQRKYLMPAGLIVAAVLIWTAIWFWFADRIETNLDNYAAARSAEQVELAWDSVGISGFPFRMEAKIVNPRGQWRAPQRSIAWTGPDTVLRFLTAGPRVVRFSAPGTHVLQISEADSDLRLETQHQIARGRITASPDGPAKRVTLTSEGTRFSVGGVLRATIAAIDADWTRQHRIPDSGAIDPTGTGQELSLVMTDIDLSPLSLDPAARGVLGDTIAKFVTRISLRGDLRPRAIDSATLARWRDAGGTIELENFDLAWGPVRLRGDGTLALDARLQPVVAVSARVAGLDRLIDVLERTGQVRPRQAAITRLALAVFTRAPADGGPPEAQVPVTVQDGRLSLGPVPLMQVPPIVWD